VRWPGSPFLLSARGHASSSGVRAHLTASAVAVSPIRCQQDCAALTCCNTSEAEAICAAAACDTVGCWTLVCRACTTGTCPGPASPSLEPEAVCSLRAWTSGAGICAALHAAAAKRTHAQTQCLCQSLLCGLQPSTSRCRAIRCRRRSSAGAV
jgi:hypothetical protein